MIIRPITKPPYLCQLEALDPRVPSHLPQKQDIIQKLKKEKAGFHGELAVQYPLSFLPFNDFHIIHGLRLKGWNHYHFQIDTLILTRSLIIPLEIKNFIGLIEFHDNGQFTRTGDSGKQEGYLNPIIQAKMQALQLKIWLRNNNYPDIPIEPLVIISFPSTIIRANPANREVAERVHQSAKIPIIIPELANTYQASLLNKGQLSNLSKELIESHVPYHPDILRLTGFDASALIKGVQCPACGYFHLIRKLKWFCPKCGHISADAHIKALTNDYPLLIGNKITNYQARDFLQVNSNNIVKYLLLSATNTYSGKNRHRIYTLNWQGPLT